MICATLAQLEFTLNSNENVFVETPPVASPTATESSKTLSASAAAPAPRSKRRGRGSSAKSQHTSQTTPSATMASPQPNFADQQVAKARVDALRCLSAPLVSNVSHFAGTALGTLQPTMRFFGRHAAELGDDHRYDDTAMSFMGESSDLIDSEVFAFVSRSGDASDDTACGDQPDLLTRDDVRRLQSQGRSLIRRDWRTALRHLSDAVHTAMSVLAGIASPSNNFSSISWLASSNEPTGALQRVSVDASAVATVREMIALTGKFEREKLSTSVVGGEAEQASVAVPRAEEEANAADEASR